MGIKRLSNVELARIAERADDAHGDILADSYVMTARDTLAREDVPRLLAEVERLKSERIDLLSYVENMRVSPLGSLLSTEYVKAKYEDLSEIRRRLEVE